MDRPRRRSRCLAAMMFAFVFPPGVLVQSAGAITDAPPASENAPPRHEPVAPDVVVTKEGYRVTRGSVMIAGEEVPYTTTVGTISLATEAGREQAKIFFIAYTKDGDHDPSDRPVTFTFNGGPGSSSVWLHLGTFGPKRVLMNDDGVPPPPPYRLVPNEGSILDVTDLVFIDPVTTGFSRAAEDVDPSRFHGVTEDINAVADFIRLYTTRFGRWLSPKYLAGESYGTTRAAGLAGTLQDRHGMYLNGLMLISSVLDFSTVRFNEGNDLSYALLLPTLTATAWYHRRLDEELQQNLERTVDRARHFARDVYLPALLREGHLSDEERTRLVREIARYTGLSEAFVRNSRMRISTSRFGKELLRSEQRTVGRLDGRFLGIDGDHAGAGTEYDPSMSAIRGPYTAALNHYVRAELGWETDIPYEILSGRVRPWNYGSAQNQYLNVAPTLRSAMSRNQALRVFVANGYYDLATPFFATEHTFSTLGLDPVLAGNVAMAYYESGHMMYIHGPSLMKLREDIVRWLSDPDS